MTLQRRALAATLALALAPQAQAQLDDPANLAGERVAPQSLADTLPINHGAPALQQLLLKLRTRASMMMIVAHPDDEDGGLLTYESRGQGARVAMLTLTRGEGGQNLVSADFNDALGLIRTQELLAADRYLGVDQFFGTEVDFGFSKTKEESFQKWTHDRVLYDAVRCVRLYRPLVLASVFVGGVTDGHGHHQVAGEITQEVFLAAADPKVFPEMNLPPWAPLKVYARVPFFRVTPQGMFDYATGKYSPVRFHNYVTGRDITHEPPATVTIHEGEVPSRLGMDGLSYVQFARKGLALQKTQIGTNSRLAAPGPYDVGYTLMATRTHCVAAKAGAPCLAPETWASTEPTAPNPAAEQSLFDGIDTTLPGIATLAITSPIKLRPALEAIDKSLADAQRLFDPKRIELTAPPLGDALRRLDGLISLIDESQFGQRDAKSNILHELRIKRVQLNNALILAVGVKLTATSEADPERPNGYMLTGAAHHIAVNIEGLNGAHLRSVTINSPIAAVQNLVPAKSSQDNTSIRFDSSFDLAPSTPVTRPYFSKFNLEQPYYDLENQGLRDAPATPNPLTATASLDYQGVRLELESTLAAEDSRTPVVIVPGLSVIVSPSTGIDSTSRTSPISLAAAVSSFSSAAATIRLVAPQGWHVEPASAKVDATSIGARKSFPFKVIPGKLAAEGRYRLTAIAQSGDKQYTESFRPVGYPGLTYTNYYTPATYRATAVDVTTAPNLRIAYLPGTGDDVPAFLPSLGVTPTLITPPSLTPQ